MKHHQTASISLHPPVIAGVPTGGERSGFFDDMKLIIAGGRDYKFTETDFLSLKSIEGVSEVVSGGAKGADYSGECWAVWNSIPIRRFEADWKTFGGYAGPKRNREMAEYADAVALFPGGKGTASMRSEAIRAGIKIYDFTK